MMQDSEIGLNANDIARTAMKISSSLYQAGPDHAKQWHWNSKSIYVSQNYARNIFRLNIIGKDMRCHSRAYTHNVVFITWY